MEKIVLFTGLFIASNSALAVVDPVTPVPAPAVLPLLGIAALAFYAVKHFRK